MSNPSSLRYQSCMKRTFHLLLSLLAILMLISGCTPDYPFILQVPGGEATPTLPFEITPYPTRPSYGPGELVDYTAQTGDTLAALAVHFNTTVEEILDGQSDRPGGCDHHAARPADEDPDLLPLAVGQCLPDHPGQPLYQWS